MNSNKLVHKTIIIFILQLIVFKQFAHAKNREVVTAIIDTGVDIKHEELKDNIWINPGETGYDSLGRNKESNGIDDDNNGFIDDIHGWNFVNNNNDITDQHGHGTHVAGIINKRKYSNSKLMILKYYDPRAKNNENLIYSLQALKYAIDNNAQLINYSGGGYTPSSTEKSLLEVALNKNIILIAAAGNNSSNNDKIGFFPGSYQLKNIIAVAAIDYNQELLSFSNYGKKTVALAALGKNVYSTLPDGKYGFMTGTSQATAIVTQKIITKLIEGDTTTQSLKQNKMEILKLAKDEVILSKNIKIVSNR